MSKMIVDDSMSDIYPHWLVPLTPEERATYSEAVYTWEERTMACLDGVLDTLYEETHSDPRYLLLSRDDVKELTRLVAYGSSWSGTGFHSSGYPCFLNQTTGRVMSLIADDALPQGTVKVLYKLDEVRA